MLSRTWRACSSKSALTTSIVEVSTAARPERKSRSPHRVAADRMGSVPPTGSPPIVVFRLGVMRGASTTARRVASTRHACGQRFPESARTDTGGDRVAVLLLRYHPVGGWGLGTGPLRSNARASH